MKLTVHSRIIEGDLAEGGFVRGESIGRHPSGRIAFQATWSGVYDGERLDEGVPYHFFRDGEVNGTRQGLHGLPTAQFAETIEAAGL